MRLPSSPFGQWQVNCLFHINTKFPARAACLQFPGVEHTVATTPCIPVWFTSATSTSYSEINDYAPRSSTNTTKSLDCSYDYSRTPRRPRSHASEMIVSTSILIAQRVDWPCISSLPTRYQYLPSCLYYDWLLTKGGKVISHKQDKSLKQGRHLLMSKVLQPLQQLLSRQNKLF